MKRAAIAIALFVSWGSQGEPKLSAGDKAPQIQFGRRVIPADGDPYVLRDLDLTALKARVDRDSREVAYTLLLWQVHSLLSIEDDETRAGLYAAAESLYVALVADVARSKEPDPRLVSNVSFLIGAAWVAWKGALDPLARERLQKSTAIREGQYRLAAEMMVEKTPFRPGLETGIEKLIDGDAAAALQRIDGVLRKTPDDPSALYWRGIALYRLQRPAEAIAPLDSCLAVRPEDGAALEARAACRYMLKEWKPALKDWEAAMALDPSARGRLQPFVDAVRKVSR